MLEADAARTFQRRIFVDTKDCSPLLEEFAPYFVIALIKNETEVDYYPSCQEYVEEYYELFKKRLENLGYTVRSYTAYSPERSVQLLKQIGLKYGGEYYFCNLDYTGYSSSWIFLF